MAVKKVSKPGNKYLNEEAVKQATLEALARLELDRHQVNVAMTAYGDDATLANGEPAADALERIATSIEAIEITYAHILGE